MSQTGLGGMAKEVSYVRTKVLLAKNVGNRHKSPERSEFGRPSSSPPGPSGNGQEALIFINFLATKCT